LDDLMQALSEKPPYLKEECRRMFESLNHSVYVLSFYDPACLALEFTAEREKLGTNDVFRGENNEFVDAVRTIHSQSVRLWTGVMTDFLSRLHQYKSCISKSRSADYVYERAWKILYTQPELDVHAVCLCAAQRFADEFVAQPLASMSAIDKRFTDTVSACRNEVERGAKTTPSTSSAAPTGSGNTPAKTVAAPVAQPVVVAVTPQTGEPSETDMRAAFQRHVDTINAQMKTADDAATSAADAAGKKKGVFGGLVSATKSALLQTKIEVISFRKVSCTPGSSPTDFIGEYVATLRQTGTSPLAESLMNASGKQTKARFSRTDQGWVWSSVE